MVIQVINMKFITEEEFEKYKKNIRYEIEHIWTEINRLKEVTQKIVDVTKERCTLKDLENNNSYMLKKLEELLEELSKKFVNKNDNSKAMKNLEDQFKRIILLLAAKANQDNDNRLIAKKPLNGYSCASCESYIGDLKEEKNENKYLNWKKMPVREREKEKDPEKEKMYRLGTGYSHMLKMVGFDNHGNVSINPNTNRENNLLFQGNYENNKIKEDNIIQLRKSNYMERIQSAHSKESKDKIYDVIKAKNHDKKLPKIKGTMSSEDFDRIIDNPNPSVNSNNENGISPKITKIMRKSHSKFNF